YRIDVIAERFVNLNGLAPHPLVHLGIEIMVNDKVALKNRIVRHRANVLLADAIRPDVMIERNVLLQNHAIGPAFVVLLHQLFARVHARNAAPAAPIERLDERGQAYVVEDAFPVEWIFKISQRLSNNALLVFLLRQQNRLWNGDAKISRQRVIEELVVSVPPEGIIDDLRSAEHCTLKISSVERHLVRDSIDDHVVVARLRHPHTAEFNVFGGDSGVAFIDLVDQGLRKSSFAPDEYADLHCVVFLLSVSAISCASASPFLQQPSR